MSGGRNIGVRVNNEVRMRRFAAQVRVSANSSGRTTMYFDGQTFDFRSRGREMPAEEDCYIAGVYGPGATLEMISEDMEFVMSKRKGAA